MSPRVKFLGAAIIALSLVFVSGGLFPHKAQALSWTQVNSNGFSGANNWGEIALFTYQGKIYVGVGNDATGGEIWRSADGTTWEAVMQGGFSDATNYLVGSFASFGGYIYAAASKAVPGGGAEIWRSASGDAGSWLQVNTDGFSDPFNPWIDGHNLTVFNGYLYAGTGFNIAPGAGAEVWRSATGDLGSWSQVNTDGFGVVGSATIRVMKVYKGYLYVGVNNTVSGSKIHRTSDGTTWETINDNGFGDGGNIEVIMLEEFNGNLYAGTINGAGTELWRSPTGDAGTWSPVVTGGFGGDISNTWPSVQSAVINGLFWVGTRNDVSGGQLWYSSDGTTWTQEGSAGFGESDNYALYTVTFKDQLYIGFSNGVTGVEIWRASGLPTLGFATESLPDGTVGNSYSTTLSASSGTSPFTYSLSSGSLPDGLSLNSNGVISGTPTRKGSFSFTVLITDSGIPPQTVTKNYTITVGSTISASTLPETGNGQGNLKYLQWLALPILGTFSLLSSRRRHCAK